jgi:hypothetical protein
MGGETIKEGVVVSLYDKGRSLENYKAQDQDGLGTCYAYSAALALSSANPNHQQLSSLDLAFGYGEKENIKKILKSDKKNSGITDLDGSNFIEGGRECQAIEIAKKNGGVCPIEKMNIEYSSLLKNDSYKQGDILKNLANYFDILLNNKKQNKVEYAAQMSELGSLIKEARDAKEQYCANLQSQNNKDDQSWPQVGLKEYLVSLWDYGISKDVESDKKNCQEWILRQLPNFVSQTNFKDDSFEPEVLIDKREKFNNQVSTVISSQNIFGDQTYNQWRKSSEATNKEAVEKQFGLELKKFIFASFTEKIPANCEGIDPLSMEEFEDSSIPAFRKIGYSRGNQKSCKEFMEKNLYNDLLDQPFVEQCGENYFNPTVTQAMVPLLELDQDIEKITNVLTHVEKPSAEPFYELLGPHCKSNRIDISNISCTRFRSPPYRDTNDLDDGKWRWLMAKNVKKSLTENKAIMVSTCANILDKIENTNYCQSKSSEDENHAINITGYRCSKGRIQYEVTNSWGALCPLENNKMKNSVMECQQKSKTENNQTGSEPNGRYWMDDAYLSGNTRFFDSL